MSKTVKRPTKDEFKRFINVTKMYLNVEHDTSKLTSIKQCEEAFFEIINKYHKANESKKSFNFLKKVKALLGGPSYEY